MEPHLLPLWTEKFLHSDAFLAFLNMTPEAAIFSNEAGQIVLTNKSAQKLFQYSEAEFLNCTIEDLVPEKSKAFHPDHRAAFFKNPKPRMLDQRALELSARRKDGTIFPMESSLFALRTKEGLLAVNLLRNISQQKKEQKNIETFAFIDALTGLPNRRYFDDHLTRSAAKARRDNKQLSLFYIDLDKFKPVNDTYGHDVGDIVLKTIATRLSQAIRTEDLLARIGGDELALILFPTTDPNFLNKIAERILKACKKPIQIKALSIQVAASIGIAISPHTAFNEQTLFRTADKAMYEAKKEGGNRFIYAATS